MARNGADLLHEPTPVPVIAAQPSPQVTHMYQLAKFHFVLRDIDVPEILRKPLLRQDTGQASFLARVSLSRPGLVQIPGKRLRWRLQ